MKSLLSSLVLTLISITLLPACSCECTGDCSFSVVSKNAEFVALVRVVSFDDFLEEDTNAYDYSLIREFLEEEGLQEVENKIIDESSPYSMTVEIVKKYKGAENRKTIKIWGDNGNQCRPYIFEFEIGKHYLISPDLLGDRKLERENPTGL